MKIFHFIHSLGVGGSERQMYEVALRLAQKGHEVAIGCMRLTASEMEKAASVGLKATEFSPKGTLLGPSGLAAMFRLMRFLRKGHFQVVHTHDLYSNLLGVPAAWLARTPVIISSRRDLASWWWYTPTRRRILRWIQTRSDRVLANSEAVKRFLIEEDGFKPERICVVANGVQVDDFRAVKAERAEVLPDIETHRTVIIHVANMHIHDKGHLYLIEAAREICRQRPDVVFVLVGDGELREEFESKVKEYRLDKNFRFLGRRSDIPQLLAVSDCAVLVSLAEGLPNAVLEYLAAGKPVIATAVGGVPEIIRHGINGLLIPPADTGAIRQAILDLVRDTGLRARLAANGQADVRSHFGYDTVIRRLEHLYRDPKHA
jgi:glycosyltransferase involved in cell wall biosynthesis